MPRWRFEAIGTAWEIETSEALSDADRAAVTAQIAAFDAEWSRFRPDSLVSHLARSGGPVPVPSDAAAMLDLYASLDDATEGAVNPLIGDSLVRLGYDSALTLRAGDPVAAPAAWREILTWDADALRLARPVTIDVGAVGKGRLVDLVLAALGDIPGDVTVDASGDLAARGAPVRVALEHPFDTTRAIGIAQVRDGALAASAVNRRAWGDGLHHVIDARTGLPVQAFAATWALAETAMLADAAATALFFDGGPRFAAVHDVEWVRMTTAGAAEWSPGFSGELFT